MSTSPTRQHYYASRPSSRAGSRPTSPPSSAQVRSQAVAKLKRAASLPRKPDGRRPSMNVNAQLQSQSQSQGGRDPLSSPSSSPAPPPPAQTPLSPNHDDDDDDDDRDETFDTDRPGSSGLTVDQHEQQEVLSPSPVATSFDHQALYPSPPTASGMQRSASAASSYHMPTPMAFSPSIGSPFYPNTPPPMADWAAMQLAQSYLPSLTPTGLAPNAYPHSVPMGVGAGRNTPSPLPTLGEIATLQRSNSNAARAKAMSKLTGGKETPSDDDYTINTPSRVNLSRAGTLGGARMLDLAALRTRPAEAPVAAAPVPDVALTDARPRLQRSFTVSSSNMGEERRSAVGRRMVERLAERRAARQKEEEEVRRLWEERRAGMDNTDEQGDVAADQGEEGEEEHVDPQVENDHGVEGQYDQVIPSLSRVSPIEPARRADAPQPDGDMLGAPDRPVSRGTMRSAQEPFEYESHLRRSLSSRTARGAVGAIIEPVPAIVTPEPDNDPSGSGSAEHLDPPYLSQPVHVADEVFHPPQPSYATPTRHAPHSSTSTDSTIQGSQSPGGSSTLSGLDSMMFVMGGHSATGSAGLRLGGHQHWPQEVHEGSEWGTPAKDLHQATFTDSPILHSPSGSGIGRNSGSESVSAHGSTEGGDHLTPPSRGSMRTDSVMSWEEVGGKEDQEIRVPTDKTYHQKSGSFSAKLKGSVRSAMKKRSQSRSSITSLTQSPPTSPMQLQPGTFPSRRGSESSTSPSHRSASKDHAARHQPSISSLAPSIVAPPDAGNASLLQHQLSHDPSQVSFLPRANLNDPRIMSSKLSPFPGIAQLESRKHADGTLSPGEAPKLIHQLSDSAVPSQQRSTPVPATQESIYALPLPTQIEDRRASADSATKRNWLAKAFGHSTSPRSSGSVSRKSSTTDVGALGEGRTLGQGAQIISSDVDPFAAPPPPAPLGVKVSKHRSASPSVSVVPEVSEEGSRFTRFVSIRGDNETPSLPEVAEKQDHQVLPQKSLDVLSRMDEVLAMGPDDPSRPEILDDPPRKLLLSTQILQVVNVHTVKDRYLFLFNDILVIAKPIISHGVHATLDMKYVVKSIVSLDKLAISGFTEEPTTEPERHPVVTNFIQRFAEDPVAACAYLVERSSPKVDPVTLASLIFKTPELDKTQVGHLLAGNDKLMKPFIDRFHFAGIRIDEAFRMFLLSLRLPTESTACEALLRGFAYRYFEANHSLVSFDRELASDLVLAIMQFNDALYGTFGFALPNHAINRETFISAFKNKDPRGLVPVDLLSAIYESIRATPLVQALASSQQQLEREVHMAPPRLPTKLTYNVWSDKITISIPAPDAEFKIKLLGEGLEFEPPLLDFAGTNEVSFRVRGTSLGAKSLLFQRIGGNAVLYGRLGNTCHFTIERAFMRYTFHVAFVSHTGLKRKYCFSVNDLETRRRWGSILNRQIKVTKSSRSRQAKATSLQEKVRQTAETVSLQVLRDALIPSEDKASITLLAPGAGAGTATATATVAGRDQSDTVTTTANGGGPRPSTISERGRAGSVSVAYAPHALKDEYDLGPLQATRGGNMSDKQSGMVDVQTGKELVLLCRQNSLLPGLLELLHAGKEGSDDMLPATPVSAPPTTTTTTTTAIPSRKESVRQKGARV